MKYQNSQFALLEPEKSLYFLVHRLNLAFSSILRTAFAKEGLGEVKPAYLGVLLLLWMEESMDETLGKLKNPGGIKISELGKYLGLEPSTMTGLIDRMERDGLVYRENDPYDRRSLRVLLTPKGTKIQKDVLSVANEVIGDVLSKIEGKTLETCILTLQKILNIIEGVDDSYE